MEQVKLPLQSPDEQLGEIERERVENERVVRLLQVVIDEELGRKQICWSLQLDAGDLSRALRCERYLRPDFRLLTYVLRHERDGRMARLLAEQSGYLPPERPERLSDAEFRARAEQAFHESGPIGESLRRRIVGEQPVGLRVVGA
jgi:hypothetical protein